MKLGGRWEDEEAASRTCKQYVAHQVTGGCRWHRLHLALGYTYLQAATSRSKATSQVPFTIPYRRLIFSSDLHHQGAHRQVRAKSQRPPLKEFFWDFLRSPLALQGCCAYALDIVHWDKCGVAKNFKISAYPRRKRSRLGRFRILQCTTPDWIAGPQIR